MESEARMQTVRVIEGVPGMEAIAGQVLFEVNDLVIDQSEVEEFCRSVKNTEWIHWDITRARESRFGTTILPGFMIPSLFSHLFFSHVEIRNVGNMLFSGIDKMRLLAPVRTGTPIKLIVTVSRVESRERGIRVSYDLDWREADAFDPAGVATFVLRYW